MRLIGAVLLIALTPSGKESGNIVIVNLSVSSDILSSFIGIGLSGVAQVSPAGKTYSYRSGGE